MNRLSVLKFIYTDRTEKVKSKSDNEHLTITTKRELCDIGTKTISRVIERKTITKNRDTGKKTCVVDYPNTVEEKPKDAPGNNQATESDNGSLPSPLAINWITQMNKNNPVHTSFISYGNEAVMSHLYARVNLVVEVPSFEERKQKPKNI